MRFDIDLTDLDSVTLVHARRPFSSVVLHVADAAGAYPAGLPDPWRAAVARSIRRDMHHLRLLKYIVPDGLVERVEERPIPLRERIRELKDFVRDVPTDDDLPGTLEHVYGAGLPSDVRAAAENPQSFLMAASRSVTRAAAVTAEVWPASAALLDREDRRVSTADTWAAKATLLTSLVPGNRLDEMRLRGAESDGTIATLARRVELFPMLAGPRANLTVATQDSPQLVVHAIGYSLPGLGSVIAEDGHPLPADPLTALLGELRASVLRGLDRPIAMGTLAARLHASPSRITYHVGNLEDASLVVRERQGSSILARRTPLGDDLVNLMSR